MDHVRAVAAFLVFAWHFIHYQSGRAVPFDYVPSVFPLALIDEGQTGVALFMTLSGYLFAKLLAGRSIVFHAFLWNRMLRLLPLLILLLAVVGVRKVLTHADDLPVYLIDIAKGIIFPTLPRGGWSITVEFHYYLILPILLWLSRRSPLLPIIVVALAMLIRIVVHQTTGEVQSLAYWTIFGRIDQFIMGMLLFNFRAHVQRRHVLALAVLIAFMAFYWAFNAQGGFYLLPSFPSPSPIWIVLPTIEGLAYAIAIAWYDTSFSPSDKGISGFIGRMGETSYSIYLFHFFVVFRAAGFVNDHIMDISNFYVACAWALVGFLCMAPIGFASFRFIESPFLRLRMRYIREAPNVQPGKLVTHVKPVNC